MTPFVDVIGRAKALGAPRGRMADGRGQPPSLRASAWLWFFAAMACHGRTCFGLRRGMSNADAACRGCGAQDITGVAQTRRAQDAAAAVWTRREHSERLATLCATARYVYLALGPSNPAATAKDSRAQCPDGLALARPARQRLAFCQGLSKHASSASSSSSASACSSACASLSCTSAAVLACTARPASSRAPGCVAACTAASLPMATCV